MVRTVVLEYEGCKPLRIVLAVKPILHCSTFYLLAARKRNAGRTFLAWTVTVLRKEELISRRMHPKLEIKAPQDALSTTSVLL